MSKITIEHCIYLTEEEVIKLAETHEVDSEDLWCSIREIPVQIVFDTETKDVRVTAR
jgi:hypothetical protein